MSTVRSAFGVSARLILLLHLLPAMVFFYWFLLGSLPFMPLVWLLSQSDLEAVQNVASGMMLLGALVVATLFALWLRSRDRNEMRRIEAEGWIGKCFLRSVPLSGAIYAPLAALTLAVELMPDRFEVGPEGRAAVFLAVGRTFLSGLTFDLSGLFLGGSEPLRGMTRGAEAVIVLAKATVTIVAVRTFLELLSETNAPLFPSRSLVAAWGGVDRFDPLIRHLYGWFRMVWLLTVVLSGTFLWLALSERVT